MTCLSPSRQGHGECTGAHFGACGPKLKRQCPVDKVSRVAPLGNISSLSISARPREHVH